MINDIKGYGGAASNGIRGRAASGAVSPASAEISGDKSTAAGEDNISISPEGLRLSQLAKAVQAAPATDDNRVQALRDAIEQKRYQIDPDRLARKLLANEQALGNITREQPARSRE